MRALGVTAQELDIRPTARLMLDEIDHPFARGEEVYDVTFENVQAGLRTDYLFRIANQRGGIVLGTGDLSELALGWATYGVGDQMSHYNVNAGVPKTLIQHLIRWVIASDQFDDEVGETLLAILDTEISPELVPGDVAAVDRVERSARTRCRTSRSSTSLRYGFRPSKIGFLAWHAWRDAGAGDWPPGFPEAERARLRRGRDPPLARGLLPALLRVRAVQALGAAQRAEGRRGRLALAARRLARAVGRLGRGLARRPRALAARRLAGLSGPPARHPGDGVRARKYGAFADAGTALPT